MAEDEAPWYRMDEVIGGKRYKTETSTLISYQGKVEVSNPYPGAVVPPYNETYYYGERTGLFKTQNGRYFTQYEVYEARDEKTWPSKSRMKALSKNKALELYWQHKRYPGVCVVSLEKSFPDVEIEDA